MRPFIGFVLGLLLIAPLALGTSADRADRADAGLDEGPGVGSVVVDVGAPRVPDDAREPGSVLATCVTPPGVGGPPGSRANDSGPALRDLPVDAVDRAVIAEAPGVPGATVAPPALVACVTVPPPGLGSLDPWVDVAGDVMHGDLRMNDRSVVFDAGALAAPDALRFAGERVCIENVVCDGTVRQI
ncbi:MAG: hypothetical protein L0206_08525, partial [Actinobacteria bacterium]|nr:hypothetical protein [Actinomycetota bacterium]